AEMADIRKGVRMILTHGDLLDGEANERFAAPPAFFDPFFYREMEKMEKQFQREIEKAQEFDKSDPATIQDQAFQPLEDHEIDVAHLASSRTRAPSSSPQPSPSPPPVASSSQAVLQVLDFSDNYSETSAESTKADSGEDAEGEEDGSAGNENADDGKVDDENVDDENVEDEGSVAAGETA
ncbi:unnamed protein product, partial [Mycena citricolor]